jgi:hypothetical protein
MEKSALSALAGTPPLRKIPGAAGDKFSDTGPLGMPPEDT